MTAPTRPKGIIDESALFGNLGIFGAALSDFAEQVPDLFFPQSIFTFAAMRRDPKLAAILAALALPIRRAAWHVDPMGARGEVAQLVADDLGLPVLGDDRAPSGARVRGVMWGEHLRLALLAQPYGFAAFEETYEIRGGQARLVALHERMAQTVAQVDVDDQGALRGMSQLAVTGQVPEIPASSLLWYAHEREGSAWVGRSVLRPAYAPWLLKRELQRIHATSIRRQGMGVPSVEALPGTNPSQAQITAAQQTASATRVGETAGMALPPGFSLKLKGVEGGLPDTLAYLQWLDQQMSTMALAGFLDLGQTATGSRALGESFLDLFLLTLQTAAQWIAATATQQTVARMVAYNFGDAEPVPAVAVGDVGSHREVTAESIQSLLASGALSADPALEAWVRSEWHLPARQQADKTPTTPIFAYDLQYGTATTNERRAQLGLAPVDGGDVPPQPTPPAPTPATQAARGRKRKAPQPGQGTLFDAATGEPVVRPFAATNPPPTSPDYSQIQGQWEQAQADLVAAYATVRAAHNVALARRVAALVDAGDLDGLASLQVTGDDGRALILAAMNEIALSSAALAAGEAEAAGHTVAELAAEDLPADNLSAAATLAAQTLAQSLASSARRAAATVLAPGVSGQDVATAVGVALDNLTTSDPELVLGHALTYGQQAGRVTVFRAAPAAHYFASEHLDSGTCKACLHVDGAQFTTLDEAEQAYASGGFKHCWGGMRCRGIVEADWSGRTADPYDEDSVPVRPAPKPPAQKTKPGETTPKTPPAAPTAPEAVEQSTTVEHLDVEPPKTTPADVVKTPPKVLTPPKAPLADTTAKKVVTEQAPKKLPTQKELDAYAAKTWPVDGLLADQRTYLESYTGDRFLPLNKALRSGKKLSDSDQAMVDAIESTMIPAPDDLTVVRRLNPDALGLTDKGLAKGIVEFENTTITDDAFMSTSLGAPTGQIGGITLHISVPAGTPTRWLKPLSSNAHENELLIGRGSTLRLGKIHQDKKTLAWVVEVVMEPRG